MNVLGIETSCDETAAAVVQDGRDVLSNCVFSQVALHGPYGGVVPEIASRSHVRTLPGIIEQSVRESGVGWGGLDAVAATFGPGLASSLLVGVAAARGLALRLQKPLVGMHHIEAHIYSVFLGDDAPAVEDVMPLLALVVSGGHTMLVRVEALGEYRVLGSTVDDAAGEAFDKGANLLGLGYPGGPAIDRAAGDGVRDHVRFPRGRQQKHRRLPEGWRPELCFSFSGLKTALLYHLKKHPLSAERTEVASLAASYQEAIVDALVDRCHKALGGYACVAVSGGVSLNSRLRERLVEMADRAGVRLLTAAPRYCADNAAMIAGLAGAGRGIWGKPGMAMDISPNMGLDLAG